MLFNFHKSLVCSVRTCLFGLTLFSCLAMLKASVFADNLVIVEFTSQNCTACRQMEPLVRQLIEKGYPIKQIDTDAEPQLAEQFGVTTLPTFVTLANGKVIDRIEGVADGFAMERRLHSSLEKDNEMQVKPVAPTAGTLSATSPVLLQSDRQPAGGGTLSPANIPWLQATVRIRVENPNGHDWGTGTIIDARGGEALILTCGHIFRDSQGSGRIEVDLFCGNTLKRVPGVCLRYDADNLDLGLVKIAPQFSVDVIPVAPPGAELFDGMTLLSTGCDNGSNPTVREHRVRSLTSVAPYVGAPFHYVQVDNAPVQGRSGGGLFTENGYLVGVCVAGNHDDNEGLFVPFSVIRNELDNAKLSVVYQTPSITRSQLSPVVLAGSVAPTQNTETTQNVRQQQVAMNDNTIRQPVFVADLDKPNMIQPGFVGSAMPTGTPSMPPIGNVSDQPKPLTLRPLGFTETRLSDREIATLEELQRRQQEGDEVIVIVRSKRNSEQPCEIIQLSDVSPEFLRALTGASSRP